MPLEGDYEPSSSTWVRNQVEKYEETGGAKGNTVQGRPIVVITSRGVSTGKLRKNPVMRVEHGGVYAAVASYGGSAEDPAWAHNFRTHPLVVLQDGPEPRDYVARLAVGAERAEWWERAVAAFPTYATYQTKTGREIPVFLLEPA